MAIGSRLVVLLVLAASGLTLGCGGDDNGGSGGTSTGNPTGTSSATGTNTPGAASPTGDEKPTPNGTGESPVPTQGGGTAPPPAAEGSPAAEPPDTGAFLTQFEGRGDTVHETCQYDPSTRVTDCGARGRYAVNPPLGGQDVYCNIALVGGTPEYVYCTSAEPSETKFYDIQ